MSMRCKTDGTWWALGAAGLLALGGLVAARQRRRPVQVGIHFENLDEPALEHVMRAQRQLGEAGVSFDTGYGMQSRTRDWEFDWSLGGPVLVEFRRFDGD